MSLDWLPKIQFNSLILTVGGDLLMLGPPTLCFLYSIPSVPVRTWLIARLAVDFTCSTPR
jgi:hypothetical protein